MSLESRIKALQAKLSLIKPRLSPPALVMKFQDGLNHAAPEGTENGGTTYLVLTPVGYKGLLREGEYSPEEWAQATLSGKARDVREIKL